MTEQSQMDAPPLGAEAKPSDESADAQSRTAGTAGKPSNFLQLISSLFRAKNGSSIREDLADALHEDSLDSANFSPGERAMLRNILRLRELRVDDVMVPRADIEAVETTTLLGALMVRFEELGHSRMPVYGENLDDPRGMVHIRDILAHITRTARSDRDPSEGPANLDLSDVDLTKSIEELGLVRKLLFVPPSMLATDLMAQMQAERVQMALVIDEYGGTDGLVSLEDIVEMVVGDIEDEHDDDEAMIVRNADGTFVVDAKAEIDDVVEEIGPAFAAGEHGENVDTIGGLIFNALGRVPARGEVVEAIPGFQFHVLDADPRRVKRLRIVDVEGAKLRRVSN
ncbi:hemolysin family protein [Aliihoeflea sp. PC F10.4]